MPPVPSLESSPARQRRNPGSIDLSSSSFASNGYGPTSPRSPQALRSIPQSPVTPQNATFGSMDRSTRFSGDFTAEANSGGGGLGSLADELADAWDDDGEGEDYPDDVDESNSVDDDMRSLGNGHAQSRNGMASDARVDDDSGAEAGKLRPQKQKSKAHHRHRRHESMYDGSDYGNDSDFEDPGALPPGLEARMAGLDALARGSEVVGDQLVDRFIISLRDLSGQTGIETSTSRLITAHSSLTSHLAHQTRTVQTLTHPLLFSPFPTLSTDDIEDLIPLINDIIPNLPFPDLNAHANDSETADTSSPSALHSLQTLLTQTSDLTLALRALNDTLHESRQLTTTASRRLKSVRELVTEICREEEAREKATRWIEKGKWDQRLGEREAGKVCGDVVSGFEAVCGEWRARLFGPEVTVA